MHFSILLCHASMHCWKDSSWRPPHLQNRSPWWSPWVWGGKESHTEQDQVNREVVAVQRCSSQPGTAGCSGCCQQGHCCGEAATICPATTLVLSHTERSKSRRISVDLLIDHLALWQELTVASSDIEECDQHDFDFWFWLSCFLWLRQHRRLLLTALAFGF